MEFNLVLRDKALQDIEDAVDWYEDKSDGLGKRFADEVYLYLSFVKSNPFSCQI